MINASIKNTNDRLDNISKEVADQKQSLEFTQDQMKDDNSKYQTKKSKKLKTIPYIHISSHQNLLNQRIVHAEIIKERPNETWEDCEASVQDMLKEKLGITDDIEFERCHRMSIKSNQNRPRTIICKATKFKDKQKILINAKLFERYRHIYL